MKYMGKFIVFLIFISIISSSASASSYYDLISNTIVLSGGTNNLSTIYTDIGNSSVLSYNSTSNSYKLNAKINSSNIANLSIENTTLYINNTVDDEYYISVGWNLIINNATLTSNNGKKFYVTSPSASGNGFYITITNAIINTGWMTFKSPNTVAVPGVVSVRNLIINNLVMKGSSFGYPANLNQASALGFLKKTGRNMTIDGLYINNVTGGGGYNAPLWYEDGASNAIIKNVTINNSSAPSWGALSWYGSPHNVTLENITITNTRGGSDDAISNKMGLADVNRTHKYTNIMIINLSSLGTGFNTYDTEGGGNLYSGVELENLIIDSYPRSAQYMFSHGGIGVTNIWVFNATLNESTWGFKTRNNNYSLANVKTSNINGMYQTVDDGCENGRVGWYQLVDINVSDSTGNPINGAVVTLIPNATNSTTTLNQTVNKWFYNLSSSTTGSDGHTPLPSNENGTMVVLRELRTGSGCYVDYYNYTANVIDSSYLYQNTNTTINSTGYMSPNQPLASVIISPDSSWYRPNPNTYQNTTVITIERERTNISLKFDNGSINVSNATQTMLIATSDADQSYILFSNTVPEYANRNVNFTVDGVFFANSSANSSGFISFNYTNILTSGSAHTFEWVAFTPIIPGPEVSGDLNGDGVVDEKDVVIVYEHMGNLTWPPFPNYDVNQDGIVDIYDMTFVTQKIPPSLIEQVYNFLRSLI